MVYFKQIGSNVRSFSNLWNREVQANIYKGIKGVSQGIKPYILETKLLKRVNRIIDSGMTINNSILSKSELKQAVKNRVLDLTYEQLDELNTLSDAEAYEFVVNKMPKNYLNLY